MAKMILSTYPAQRSGAFLQVSICIAADNAPLASKTVEIKRTADAAQALEAYKQEAAALNVGLVVSMRMARGDRSPPGFKALSKDWHEVNV